MEPTRLTAAHIRAMEARRLIIAATKSVYKPGMAHVGRDAMHRYLGYRGIPEAEVTRIQAAADHLFTMRGA